MGSSASTTADSTGPGNVHAPYPGSVYEKNQCQESKVDPVLNMSSSSEDETLVSQPEQGREVDPALNLSGYTKEETMVSQPEEDDSIVTMSSHEFFREPGRDLIKELGGLPIDSRWNEVMQEEPPLYPHETNPAKNGRTYYE